MPEESKERLEPKFCQLAQEIIAKHMRVREQWCVSKLQEPLREPRNKKEITDTSLKSLFLYFQDFSEEDVSVIFRQFGDS